MAKSQYAVQYAVGSRSLATLPSIAFSNHTLESVYGNGRTAGGDTPLSVSESPMRASEHRDKIRAQDTKDAKHLVTELGVAQKKALDEKKCMFEIGTLATLTPFMEEQIQHAYPQSKGWKISIERSTDRGGVQWNRIIISAC